MRAFKEEIRRLAKEHCDSVQERRRGWGRGPVSVGVGARIEYAYTPMGGGGA